MGQCVSETEVNISDNCVICNKFLLGKPIFVCPLCNTKIGHMDCVTIWIMIHKLCPYCYKEITTH